jgi:hypothetical protein
MSVSVAREGEVARWNEDVGGRRRRRSSEGVGRALVKARNANAEGRARTRLKALWSCPIVAGGKRLFLGAGRPLTGSHSTPGREPLNIGEADWLGNGVRDLSSAHSSPRRCMQTSRVHPGRPGRGYFERAAHRDDLHAAASNQLVQHAFRCRWTSQAHEGFGGAIRTAFPRVHQLNPALSGQARHSSANSAVPVAPFIIEGAVAVALPLSSPFLLNTGHSTKRFAASCTYSSRC